MNKDDENDIPLDMHTLHFSAVNYKNEKLSGFHKKIEELVETYLQSGESINLNINERITSNEIYEAIAKASINKASGPDQISNEMLKCSSHILIEQLLLLFNDILDSGIFPQSWRLSFLTPVFKKGDRNDANNYRGIAISSCLGKVFLSIINKRISTFLENSNSLDEAQNGFRKDCRTTDNIFIMKTLINKYKLQGKKLFVCFIDFKKAFDNVWRAGLFFKLYYNDIDGKILKLLGNMYKQVTYKVKRKGCFSDIIYSNIGVRQGCVTSPTMFNVYMNDLKLYFEGKNVNAPTLDQTEITHLLFADDLVLLSLSENGLKQSLRVLEKFCSEWRLELNISKTKILIFNSSKNAKDSFSFKFSGSLIEVVNSYTYLGITFTSNCTFKAAMINVKSKALRSWFKIKQNLCTSDETPTHILLSMFRCVSMQIALYGCEVWGMELISTKNTNPFTNWNKAILNHMQVQICNSILNLPKRVSNIGSIVELGLYPLTLDIIVRMLKYYNRLRTMDTSKLVYKALQEDYKICALHQDLSFSGKVLHILDIYKIPHTSTASFSLTSVAKRLQESFHQIFRQNCLPVNPITGKTNKLRCYGKHKSEISFSEYLLYIKKFFS